MKDRKPIRLIASDLDGTLYYGARELGKMTPAQPRRDRPLDGSRPSVFDRHGKTGVYAGGNHPRIRDRLRYHRLQWRQGDTERPAVVEPGSHAAGAERAVQSVRAISQ